MSPRPEVPRRRFRWLVPAALLALAPKCVVCLAAYFGLGAALGLTSVEICGGNDVASAHPIAWMLAAGLSLGVAGLFLRARRRA